MSQISPNQENKENDQKKQEILNLIKSEINRIRTYTPKVGIFGDTGVGKSSLCNALFGREVAKISDVEACTREPQKILLGEENKGGIILIDVPGVGEDPKRHEEYIKLYKSLLPELDLILWAIKADDRKYLSSIDVYEKLLKPNLDKCPVIFVVTQVDKIEPYREWDIKNNRPGKTQELNILRKINDISSTFDVPTSRIVPVAANDGYNLVELVNRVVDVLPKEKKYSFTRETKEENVSEEAAKEAEKGIIDHIKEIAGEAWDALKYYARDFIVESAPKLLKSAASWFRSLF